MKMSSPDNLPQRKITQSKDSQKKRIPKVSKSVWAYVYLIFIS